MKKRICLFTAAVLILSSAYAFYITQREYSRQEFAMDTVITLKAKGRNTEIALEAAVNEIHRIDRLMNAYNEESEIHKINSAPCGTKVAVSDEVFDLIALAKDISEKTDGAFDISVKPLSDLWNINSDNPTVPSEKEIQDTLKSVDYRNIILNSENKTVTLAHENMSIALGGIAKGYTADKIAEIFKKYKIKSGLADLGGNIYAIGKKSSTSEWKIGIQTPFKPRGEYFKICSVSDTSVVTSGAYERYFKKDGKIYHHILNPKNGYPSESGIQSATVICPNSAVADALSTAVYAAGTDKAEKFLKNFDNVKVIILAENGKTIEYPISSNNPQ